MVMNPRVLKLRGWEHLLVRMVVKVGLLSSICSVMLCNSNLVRMVVKVGLPPPSAESQVSGGLDSHLNCFAPTSLMATRASILVINSLFSSVQLVLAVVDHHFPSSLSLSTWLVGDVLL